MANGIQIPVDSGRNIIGKIVLIVSGSIIVAISITLILTGVFSKDPAVVIVKDVFNALLPVLATWVGTVIAFYFGKENFESASRQLNNIVNKISPEMLKEVPVTQVMIDLDTMFKYCNGSPTTTLGDLTNDFNSNSDKSRLPILDKNNIPLYIMHKDEYDKLAATPDNLTKTIASFNQYGFNQAKGFVIIPETATLKDAQEAYKKIPTCQDVFITKGGTNTEALVGWLTDGRILNFLQ